MNIVSIIVGFLTGVMASMGLGGGFVLVVWLTLFMDVEQKTAQGINLLFFLPIALVSLCLHLRHGLVNKKLVKKLALGGVVGAVLGTLGTRLLDNSALRMLFALFLLSFGLRELFAPHSTKNEDSALSKS
ncbi:MAG: sulfite exporter TauE/SafE family protein [Oscillospiraceae bacterium]